MISRGTLAALDDHQLRAVLAHERAHLHGRHHLLLGPVRALAEAMPHIRLFTTGATELARLLEMCADDRAVKTYGARALLGGLLALAGAAAAPTGSLGATGADILTRAGRLATPASPLTNLRARILLTATAAVITLGPVTLGLLFEAGMIMCGPMPAGM